MNTNKLYLSLIVALILALIASLAVGAGSPGAEPPVPTRRSAPSLPTRAA